MSLGLPLRVFVALLAAIVPAVLFGMASANLFETILAGTNSGLLAFGTLVVVIVWAAILSILVIRSVSEEATGMVALARHGDSSDQEEAAESSNAYARLAFALDERNRQVATLAAETQAAPIARDPREVASHVVRTARRLTGDPTWNLAVVRSDLPAVLPAGVYDHQGDAPSPIGDLEQWATTAEATDEPTSARKLEGPWGAFLVVDVASHDDVSAALLAPWEGRPEPSRAELDLLSLLGQHAGTNLEHALLYSTVRLQADELDRMARIQADFLRGVSHDLQTPLTSIRALADELEEQPGLDAQMRENLDIISHQADRLRRMVGQLLASSRLEAGALTPRQEIFAVRPLIERSWSALRAGRPFTLEVSGDAQLAVADPDRLEQVLWALLDNAVKYSAPDSPIAAAIRPGDGDTMEITITDQGVGMDPPDQAQAFDQFYRSDNARRLVPDGSGVGLYAARGLIEAMGGMVTLTSSLGHGTTVSIRLPAELIATESS